MVSGEESLLVDGALAGGVVLVTGGTRGIGAGIAEACLAADAAHVRICARTRPDALPGGGDPRISFVAVDVRDHDAVARMVDDLASEQGHLDVLVNNAGGAPHAMAADASPRFHSRVIELNLLAALHCAQAANRVMQRQQDGGAIVNVASVSALRPSPGTAAYGAAKAGLVSLTRSLAVEWAPAVRVNCVTPGLILTETADDHYRDAQAVASTVPLGRFGTPAEVGAAVVFLASSASAYTSGSNLVLDGGGEWPAFLRAQG